MVIEDYRDSNYPIRPSNSTEAIRFRMEQMGMTQNDLAKIISHKSRASEILNRKRELTLSMIKKLNQAFSKALL